MIKYVVPVDIIFSLHLEPGIVIAKASQRVNLSSLSSKTRLCLRELALEILLFLLPQYGMQIPTKCLMQRYSQDSKMRVVAE